MTFEEIAALSDNWNGYGANAFSPKLIEKAINVANQLIYQPYILPTGRDSIQMEYHKSTTEDYLELEVFENSIKLFYYKPSGILIKQNASISEINELLKIFYEESSPN
jgi:hypothetical protein